MHFVYIDDSGDEKVYGYSALCIPADEFRAILISVKGFRRRLRQSDGIYINREFHAVDFVAGRGRLGRTAITKWRRRELFADTLSLVTTLPGVRLFNAFGTRDGKLQLLERLVNRINRNMKECQSKAVLIFDEGEERTYTRLVRKMGVFNPIKSMYRCWEDGNETKNIPIEHVIEDPTFRRSKQSYFIQLADFCGYSLLQKERPTTNLKKARLRLHECFDILRPICVREANQSDPFGIVR
jgi:hypothetical protein